MVEIKSVDGALRRAKVLARAGNLAEAQQMYDAILKRFPNNRRASAGLKSIIKKRPAGTGLSRVDVEAVSLAYSSGQFDRALTKVNALLAQYPEFPLLHNLKGASLLALGEAIGAEQAFRTAIALEPKAVQSHNNLGNALKAQARYPEAIDCFEEALGLDPDFATAWNNLGNANNEQGRSIEAVKCFEKALSLQPDLLEAHSNLANVHQSIGNIPEAIVHYEKALNIEPDQAVVHRNLSTIKHYTQEDAQVEHMEALLGSGKVPATAQAHLNFALGKAYDDLGQVDKAFHHLDAGNRLWRRDTGYRAEQDQKLFSHIRSLYQALRDAPQNPAGEEPAKVPIFVVGMPRSGTSLVEQILASHPDVHGAGELGALDQIVASVLRGEIAGAEAIQHIRTAYLDAIGSLGQNENIIVDKMPLNFRWIGLIALAMPQAKIIHCDRCPMATGWSIFRHLFPSRALGFAYSLEDIAGYTELANDLMAYWQQQVPGRIYELNYERLTENQEVETAQLLQACGLEFDQRCVDFHLTDRTVRTASAKQVRLPLYQGSSLAWKAYQGYLAPLAPETQSEIVALAS